MSDECGKSWKEGIVAYFAVLVQHLHRDAEGVI
jgi:hypothetical protein